MLQRSSDRIVYVREFHDANVQQHPAEWITECNGAFELFKLKAFDCSCNGCGSVFVPVSMGFFPTLTAACRGGGWHTAAAQLDD